MDIFDFIAICSMMFIFSFISSCENEVARDQIITAIVDNGCSSHQKLKPTKTNADVYNYDALSTSY